MTTVLQLRRAAPADVAGEGRLLADTVRRRGVLLGQRLTTGLCISLFEVALERVRLSIALGDTGEAGRALHDASGWACAGELGARFERGEASIEFPGERAHRAAAEGAGLTLPQWIDALAVACIARDAAALALLADADILAIRAAHVHVDPGAVGAEPFWLPYGRAFALVVAGDARAAEEAQTALNQLRARSPIDPDNLAALDRPVLEGIAALARGERDGWDDRIYAALAAFHAYYNRPDFYRLLPGYVPLGLLALSVLAQSRGITLTIESPYIPAGWLREPPAGQAARLAFQAARMHARAAAEIRWWFDLAGVPSARRVHRLVDQGGAPVAVYEASYSDSGPHVHAEFELDERSEALLDDGELLLVSELHARRVPGAADRFHLNEAIAALDSVPAVAPRSNRGRTLHRKEPGRFDRARLEAARRTYAELLAGLQAPQPAVDARAGALVWIEVIKSQLVELLDRLPGPDAQELVRSLRPRDEDYEKAFVPEAVPRARAAYASWDFKVDAPEGASCARHIYVAPAGMLKEDNELSRYFPGGYRSIAHLLDPHRVWVCWRYARPGERPAVNYDGLVWCDDHWAWFPKPFRALANQR